MLGSGSSSPLLTLRRSCFLGALLAASALLAPGVAVADPAPASAEPWELGLDAFRGEDLTSAAHHFQSVLDRHPEHFGAHLMLGRCLAGLGHRAQAVEAFAAAAAHAPGEQQRAEAVFLLADLHLQADEPRSAREALEQLDPEALGESHRRSLIRQRALARLLSGAIGEGLEDLRRATAASPRDTKLARYRGQMELAYGTPADAVTALEAAHALERAQGREPDFELHLSLAEAFLGAGRAADALPSLRAAGKLDPAAWKPPCSESQVLLALERWAEARPTLESCLALAPEERHPATWRLLGLSYEKERQWAESRAAYVAAGDAEAVARVDHNREVYLEELAEEERRKELAEIARREREARDEVCRLKGLESGCLESDGEATPANR